MLDLHGCIRCVSVRLASKCFEVRTPPPPPPDQILVSEPYAILKCGTSQNLSSVLQADEGLWLS